MTVTFANWNVFIKYHYLRFIYGINVVEPYDIRFMDA